PAARPPRPRPSPATSSHPPVARERTSTGCTTPCERTDSASPLPASASNRLRGWRGFGWTASTGSSASSAAFSAPPSSTPSPRPSPLRSGALDKLHRHLPVGIRAARAAVVRDRRQTVARRLRKPHRPRHGRLEHELTEVTSYLVLDIAREARSAVDHRQQ